MHDRDDDVDDIDRAYRAAVNAAEDDAAARRRRSAILQSVRTGDAATAAPADRQSPDPIAIPNGNRPAANEARWRPGAAWWRGVAAACLMASSALLVLHLRDAPEATVAPAPYADTPHAPAPHAPAPYLDAPHSDPRQVAPTAPAGAAARPAEPPEGADAASPAVAKAAPPRSPAAPAPARVIGAAEPARVPAPRRAQRPTVADPPPDPESPRSAFRGDGMAAARPTERAESASADLATQDGAQRDAAIAAPPARLAAPAEPDKPAPSAPRVAQRSAADGGVALGATATLRQPAAAAETGKADARPAPPSADAARPADTAEPTPPGPRSSLLAAAASGNIAAARRLLPGIDPDAERDADGRTALAIAVLRSDLPLVKLLLAGGANRLEPDRFGQTPAGYAAASGSAAIRQAFGRP